MNAPKKKMKLWVGIAIFAIVGGIFLFFSLRKKASLGVSYHDVVVKRDDLEVTILSTGTVAAENRVEIKPPVAGRVERVLVKEGQVVKKGQPLAVMSSTERAALIDAATGWGAAELKNWEESYKPTPILAPINGTIILRNVESGQTFTNTDSVFVMSDRLTVKAQVDETDISEIKVKQKATIVLDAYPKDTIAAHVDQIAFDAKTTNNVTTYDADVLPESTPAFMRSGMTANVTFQVASKKNVLVVPNDALRVQEDRFAVLTKSDDPKKPNEKQIEIGVTDGKQTEVTDGLNEGDVILQADIQKKDAGGSAGGSPFSPLGGRRGGK